MTMSAQGLAALIDLVEIKLSCMEIWDRDDRREAMLLQHCLAELRGMAPGSGPARTSARRGRRPAMSAAAAF